MEENIALRTTRLAFGSIGSFLPEPMAALAERLYFSARKHKLPERERATLDEAERVELLDGPHGERIAAWRWTPDFPWERADRGIVLLVHGWEGRAAQLGAFVRPLLERGFTVVGADAPGHGQSEGAPLDLPAYAELIREIARTLEQRGDGKVCAIVAHSFGAAAATLAIADDGRDAGVAGLDVDAAVLVAPPSDLSLYVESFSRIMGLTRATAAIFRARLEERFGREWWHRFALDKRAAALAVPCLVAHDEDDRETPFTEGERLARGWPGAELVVTKGLGHRRILRADAVIARAVDAIDRATRAS